MYAFPLVLLFALGLVCLVYCLGSYIYFVFFSVFLQLCVEDMVMCYPMCWKGLNASAIIGGVTVVS
jgi:hypothetical protein